MPAKDGLRFNDMRRTKEARPEPGQPHHQGPVTAAQSNARRRMPQGDAELMAKEQVLRLKPAGDLKKSITNITSECRIANIVRDPAMILTDDATPKPDEIFGKDKEPSWPFPSPTEGQYSGIRHVRTGNRQSFRCAQLGCRVGGPAVDQNKIRDRHLGNSTMARGTVKWFNPTKGYGFIQPQEGGRYRDRCQWIF
jgi:hypothetical protein